MAKQLPSDPSSKKQGVGQETRHLKSQTDVGSPSICLWRPGPVTQWELCGAGVRSKVGFVFSE